MKMYYNRSLAPYGIGWGQQFYLEYIYEHPGTHAQEMVDAIRVDKATLTKVIKELMKLGYVETSVDKNDRRIRRLYLTDSAIPAVQKIKQSHASFNEILREGLSEDDLQKTEDVLAKIMENFTKKVWHRMEREHFENR